MRPTAVTRYTQREAAVEAPASMTSGEPLDTECARRAAPERSRGLPHNLGCFGSAIRGKVQDQRVPFNLLS